jgi:hypothetical protein
VKRPKNKEEERMMKNTRTRTDVGREDAGGGRSLMVLFETLIVSNDRTTNE